MSSGVCSIDTFIRTKNTKKYKTVERQSQEALQKEVQEKNFEQFFHAFPAQN